MEKLIKHFGLGGSSRKIDASSKRTEPQQKTLRDQFANLKSSRFRDRSKDRCKDQNFTTEYKAQTLPATSGKISGVSGSTIQRGTQNRNSFADSFREWSRSLRYPSINLSFRDTKSNGCTKQRNKTSGLLEIPRSITTDSIGYKKSHKDVEVLDEYSDPFDLKLAAEELREAEALTEFNQSSGISTSTGLVPENDYSLPYEYRDKTENSTAQPALTSGIQNTLESSAQPQSSNCFSIDKQNLLSGCKTYSTMSTGSGDALNTSSVAPSKPAYDDPYEDEHLFDYAREMQMQKERELKLQLQQKMIQQQLMTQQQLLTQQPADELSISNNEIQINQDTSKIVADITRETDEAVESKIMVKMDVSQEKSEGVGQGSLNTSVSEDVCGTGPSMMCGRTSDRSASRSPDGARSTPPASSSSSNTLAVSSAPDKESSPSSFKAPVAHSSPVGFVGDDHGDTVKKRPQSGVTMNNSQRIDGPPAPAPQPTTQQWSMGRGVDMSQMHGIRDSSFRTPDKTELRGPGSAEKPRAYPDNRLAGIAAAAGTSADMLSARSKLFQLSAVYSGVDVEEQDNEHQSEYYDLQENAAALSRGHQSLGSVKGLSGCGVPPMIDFSNRQRGPPGYHVQGAGGMAKAPPSMLPGNYEEPWDLSVAHSSLEDKLRKEELGKMGGVSDRSSNRSGSASQRQQVYAQPWDSRYNHQSRNGRRPSAQDEASSDTRPPEEYEVPWDKMSRDLQRGLKLQPEAQDNTQNRQDASGADQRNNMMSSSSTGMNYSADIHQMSPLKAAQRVIGRRESRGESGAGLMSGGSCVVKGDNMGNISQMGVSSPHVTLPSGLGWPQRPDFTGGGYHGGASQVPHMRSASLRGTGGDLRPAWDVPGSPNKVQLGSDSGSLRMMSGMSHPSSSLCMSSSLILGERIDPRLPLEQQQWYHGAIGRVDAEALLRCCREGSYLVRNSESNRRDFSLSIKSSLGYMHLKIVANSQGRYILGQFSQPFYNIPQMVYHYSMHKLPIKGAEHISLMYPVSNELL